MEALFLRPMEDLQHWIKAMRLRTLPLSLSSILVGSSVAFGMSTQYKAITIWAILTTLCLQILSNLANDYGDSRQGTDNESRIGPMRSVQSGAISSQAMLKGIVISAVLALLCGLQLIYISFWRVGDHTAFWIFLGLGLFAIAAAIRYTAGKNPYGYRGLGDVYVMLFFGIIGVCGSYFLHTKEWDWIVLLPAITIGAFASAVLNLNNMRDRENDEKSGKITLVVRLGIQNALRYHVFLFIIGWLALIIYLLLIQAHWAWLTLLFLPVHLIHLGKVLRHSEPHSLDPELKKVALSTFGIGLILFLVVFI